MFWQLLLRLPNSHKVIVLTSSSQITSQHAFVFTSFTLAIMVRKRDNGYKNLGQMVLFKALDLVSGHSRELAPRPSSYTQKRPSFFKTPTTPAGSEKTTWPGVEAPADLPHLPPRTHCLTPDPFRDNADTDKEFEQLQSPLFKLPPDVLRLIYEEVVGNRTIHIVRRHDRLSHAICKVNKHQCQDQCKESQCRGLKLPNGTYESAFGCSDLLPILQTCRKMLVTWYLEVLHNC